MNHQFLRSTAEYNLVSCFTISCVCIHICIRKCACAQIYEYTHTAFLHTILGKELWTNPCLDLSTLSLFELSTTHTILLHKKWAPHGNCPQEHFLCKISFPYVHGCSAIHLKLRMIMNVLSTVHFPVKTNQQILLSLESNSYLRKLTFT